MRYDIHQGLVPDLAESYEINDDQTVYRLTVRDDARWHDGRPVRAADVIFTVSAIQNTGYRSPLEVSFAGITVEQIDERTVQFTLSEPFAPFLSLLTVGILPSHLWENISPVNASVAELNKKPIGSGPYKFEKFVKDTKGNIRSYTFVRNSDYYLGAPYIEKLHFKFYPDMTAALEALRNHNIEGLSFLPLEAIPDFEDDNKLQILFPSLQQYTAAFFNPEHQEILDETEVREALVLATDKDALVEKVLGAYGHTVDSFILEGMVGEHPDIRKIGYDKEAASAKLEEAGWELAEGSEVRTKDGTELDLTIVTLNSSELTATANELKNQWSQIGVRVAVSAVDSTTFQNDILKNRGYDILISGELYGIDPDPYAFWHSSQTEFPGLNLAQFSNRKADELIEQARGTSDLAQRAQAYRDLQDLVAKDIAAIFLYQPAYSYVSSSKIQNVDVGQIVIPADRFANINTWYIKTKKVFVKVDTENES